MLLNSGSRIGSYEVLALIGEGGMGEVYRARDTRLKRDVALKVLPRAFASDPERMLRLQREAEVLASLNHPNIAAIYGIESGALVMELVEGETLNHSVPPAAAIQYSRQIAEALEYAHERGVIHRDLKPANVKVTADGVVKLLDFGLAKAIENRVAPEDPSTSPTMTLGATQVGMIMGTAAYMSPEQAQGRTVDRRSDIFSFGALLYELLSGRRAFAGESVPDTLASVLKLEPDWSALPSQTPPAVRTLMQRCLTKDRRQRLQSIGEARIVLENPADQVVHVRDVRRWPWIAATALVTVFAGLGAWGWLRTESHELQPVTHIAMTLNPPLLRNRYASIAVSLDGSRIVYPAQKGLYVKLVDKADPEFIPNSEGALSPTFSPDGQSVAFILATAGGGRLQRLSLAGGPPRDLGNLRGTLPIHWGTDDKIYFSDRGALMRVPAKGGSLETLATPTEGTYFPVQLLPGERTLLVSARRTEDSGGLYALKIASGELTTLFPTARFGRYVDPPDDPFHGHLLYEDSGGFFAVPFDAERVRVEGTAVSITNVSSVMGTSRQGMLAYIRADFETTSRQLFWSTRGGKQENVPAPPRNYGAPLRLSPDGNQLSVQISGEIWIVDLLSGSMTKVATGGNNRNAMWSYDGRTIYFQSGASSREGSISAVPADRSSAPIVLETGGGYYLPSDVTPDGKAILVRREDPAKPDAGVVYLSFPIDRGKLGEGTPFLESQFQINNLRISPNGEFVAYQSQETGRTEINVSAYPGPGVTKTISTGGGNSPVWSRDGRELLYLNSGKVMVVDILPTAKSEFLHGKPRVLYDGPVRPPWDVARDGRFLMLRAPGEELNRPDELHFITNWFDELQRLAPRGK